MKMRRALIKALIVFLALLLAAPQGVIAQSGGEEKPFKQEELDQLVAPIALYPDSLLTQILMASTYPLEVVQADRWAKQNKSMKGDALAKALEAQPWDPSVKSLVNFPDVLAMMSEKLDWTQKLGDAFLAQQKDVMGSVQKLRAKAQASGNLKTTKEQVVKVEQQTIIIEPASPQVVYVPAYNPTVVYGAWPYPAYPPYPVYPPGYVATTAAFSFMAGAAVGAAWGYAWGNANWRGGDVNINVNQNVNINNSINREKYQQQYQGKGQAGQGQWQHDASHRGGVAYRDQGTAQKYNRGGSRDAQSRDAYRGRSEQGRQDLSKGTSDRSRGGQQMDRGGASAGQSDRGGAISGADRGGSATREASNRGNQSMASSRAGGGGGSSVSRESAGGGASRGSGGGGRSGGGRAR
jgi:hypothetical protein